MPGFSACHLLTREGHTDAVPPARRALPGRGATAVDASGRSYGARARPAGAPDSPRREIARIAVPVSLEFVLMLVLNFVNQVVVGALGATAIAAVGFANSLVFILVLTLARSAPR